MCEDTPLRYAPPLQVCETTELGKLSLTDSVEKYPCSIVRDDVRVQPKVKLYGAASIGHSNYACLFATHAHTRMMTTYFIAYKCRAPCTAKGGHAWQRSTTATLIANSLGFGHSQIE